MNRTSHAGYRNAKSPMHRMVTHGGPKIAAKIPTMTHVGRNMRDILKDSKHEIRSTKKHWIPMSEIQKNSFLDFGF